MKKTVAIISPGLILAAVLFLPVVAMAQDPGGGPDAPIDGGLGVLLAAGTAYGIKKYRQRRKGIEETQQDTDNQ